MLLKGNCLETLKNLKTASVDSIVTDPPYELGFMGKSWDNSGIAYNQDLWAECLRVLKPGGHLLAFSGSRTYHRMVVAIEDSGFEIRDQIMWLYGSGFPKSLDVSKAIEGTLTTGSSNKKDFKNLAGEQVERGNWGIAKAQQTHGQRETNYDETAGETRLGKLAPTTPEAQQWQGWGTALKPAHEPIVVARKPLIGTVANNVLTYGTGAINIDGSRVGSEIVTTTNGKGFNGSFEGGTNNNGGAQHEGRWPANVIHDGSDEVLAGFPTAKGGTWNTTAGARHFNNDGEPTLFETSKTDNSSGSAARFFTQTAYDEMDFPPFFYCSKAGKKERNAGVEGNTHPTVKPLALMRYLIKLVTPPNGVVLDPFLGSGTTAVAAVMEGFDWIGCELTEDYWPIIEARIAWAEKERNAQTPETTQPTLFGEKL